jgi:hypothetical protein
MVPGAFRGASRQAFRRCCRLSLCWAGLALAAGCGERERLTFPVEDPGDGQGPFTEISQPSVPDTLVFDGDLVTIQGRAIDSDGIDSVYFELGGVNQSFAPIDGEGADTVNFALQLSTLSFSGSTVVFQAYGVDLLGDQGGRVSRQIRIE